MFDKVIAEIAREERIKDGGEHGYCEDYDPEEVAIATARRAVEAWRELHPEPKWVPLVSDEYSDLYAKGWRRVEGGRWAVRGIAMILISPPCPRPTTLPWDSPVPAPTEET